MRKLLMVAVGLQLLAISVPANAAICLEPRAPSLLFLRKPLKPYCASTRSCEEWQIESYKNEVSRYYQQLEDYISSVDRFRKKASEYAQCMADLD